MIKACSCLILTALLALMPCFTMLAESATNPAQLLTTDEQAASIASLKDMDDGRFYTMDYTADYKLDEVLQKNIADVPSMIAFIQENLLSGQTQTELAPQAGCSAFVVTAEDGRVLCGRNFDYKMDMTAVLIRTAPKDGYKSIGLVDTGWVGYGLGSLSDGETDLSMAVSFPYLIMDGMNEKGLTVSVLQLDGEPTRQDRDNPKIMTTVAMRLLLDRAATVEEAIALLDTYDMQAASPSANFHFLLADASGKAVVIEYCVHEMEVVNETYVSNFYLSPSMNGFGHGQNRYEVMKAALSFKDNVLTESEAMSLLELVSQKETEESTSMTQWSVVYDLTELDATIAIRRDYGKLISFALEGGK
ncbi:MAG: linear amide C-N hydrolase [Clostridiales bacterium]|nr:linear amide C-N hydrolase [Clostridiales bacterium]